MMIELIYQVPPFISATVLLRWLFLPMLPSDLVVSVSRQWPCREQQARQLAHLLCVRKIRELGYPFNTYHYANRFILFLLFQIDTLLLPSGRNSPWPQGLWKINNSQILTTSVC